MEIPVQQITESKINPRRTFNEAQLQELIASVGKMGVLQPLVVRSTVNGTYEVVCGHRRLRAAKEAGLEAVPVVVRELSDLEVLEAMLVENLQREDLHPLEEAEGYQTLMRSHQYSADDVALKVGKSKGYVYGRLKLCSLPEPAKKAFRDGELNPSIALLVARIPDKKLAEQATKEVLGNRHGRGPMSFREASEWVHDHYMLRLSEAPFPVDDAELVRKAGTCNACPKRTGNQRELFGDIKSADVCTDPTCFRSKVHAFGERRLAGAKKEGLEVLSGGQAKQVFGSSHSNQPSWIRGDEYIDPDEPMYEITQGSNRSVRKALGSHAPPPVLARDPHTGVVREPHRKKEVLEAGVAAGKISKGGKAKASPTDRALSARARHKARVEVAQRRALMAAIVAAAEETVPTELWGALAETAIRRAWHETLKEVAIRRGIEVKKAAGQGLESHFVKISGGLGSAECRGLAVEVILGADYGYGYNGKPHTIDEVCNALRIDRAAVERAAASEIPPPKKAKPAPVKAAPAKTEAKKQAKRMERVAAKVKGALGVSKKGDR